MFNIQTKTQLKENLMNNIERLELADKVINEICERLENKKGLKFTKQNILKCFNEESNKNYGDYYDFIDSLLNCNDFSLNTATEIFDYLKENDPTLEKSLSLVKDSIYSDWGIAELNVFILSGLLVDDMAKHNLRSLLMCFENEFYLVRNFKNNENIIKGIYEQLLPSWEYEAGINDTDIFDRNLFNVSENNIRNLFYSHNSFNDFVHDLATFIVPKMTTTLFNCLADFESDFKEFDYI
jgi:hypothetical protein